MTRARAIACGKAAIELLKRERSSYDSEEFREAYEILGDMHMEELDKEINGKVVAEREAENA